MDILIKGMDLTEDACAINLTICSNGKVYGSQQVGDSMVRINTTAVALPEHHGRLIEADKLIHAFDNRTDLPTGYEIYTAIAQAETIVEATE